MNFVAVDAAGLSSTCSFSIALISDYNPPIITCPGKIAAVLDAGQSTKSITWANPTIVDENSFTISVQPSASGALFPLGFHLFDCSSYF